MIFTRRSTALVLFGLQTVFSLFFYFALNGSLAPGLRDLSIFDKPNYVLALNGLNFGLALILYFAWLWKHEYAGIILLLAIHIVCPLLFFTDLTRNPYLTQITLFNVWIPFLWIGWLWESVEKKVFIFPRTALNLPLFAFLIVATLSWALSFLQHPAEFHTAMFWEGFRNWLFLIVNAAAVFFIAYRIDDKWRPRFLWLTFWIAGIASVYGLMQFYGMEQIWQKTLTPFANRPVSTFGNPNFLSSYLLLVIPLLAVSAMSSKKTSSAFISLVLLVFSVAGLIATMTRSTWVGAFVALALLPVAPPVREIIRANSKKFYLFAAIVLASIVFWPQSKLGGYKNPWQRIYELKEITTGKRYHPWSQRILIWSSSFGMVKDHFFLGKGWGLMELFYPYYQGGLLFHPVLGEFRTHANNSHNEVMEIWSQTGLIGLGIYTWLWVILILFGLKLSRSSISAQGPPSSAPLWAWTLTAAAIGMFVDNFFGNVSLHFCVPAFLFWWQAGLVFGMGKTGTKKTDVDSASDYWIIPLEHNGRKALVLLGILFFSGSAVLAFRKEFQEIYYFTGFKLAKAGNLLNPAREALETAWKWFPHEVNTDYELANTYARTSQEANRQGLTDQANFYRKKCIWAYLESLRANAGYDEIYFNLAATQATSNWLEDDAPDISLENPRGMPVVENARAVGGAIHNFSRALAINPMGQEGYNFLGNIYMQNHAKYAAQAAILYAQGIRFFPENKDFRINMAFLQIQEKKFAEAEASLTRAMELDPFYEITRKNVRALVTQTGNPNLPLAQVDHMIDEINPLAQAKNWPALRDRIQYGLKVLPNCSALWLILANVHFEMRSWDKAEAAYLKTLEIDSGNTTAVLNLGLTYRVQNKIPEARKAFERLARLNPGNPDAKKHLESLPK